ncbi:MULTISPECIES: hypothetical protein [Pseudovibrio]|uniref:Uncharacterized protein n=1 Tax=Pseudovibrio ascidiaceicola TaxID=285279 RepID=A0A1I4FNY9_9HYPH|nr:MULTISPECIES: hypothetical protein [Pseudovibrio]KZL13850.1 hypothetical protein PsAD26_01315 [Pseudovibrio sp. Ad26]SFL19545.1 hypothetical protein SAMN04488518_1219 [Pseudovibrio ascidiaceicola]
MPETAKITGNAIRMICVDNDPENVNETMLSGLGKVYFKKRIYSQNQLLN